MDNYKKLKVSFNFDFKGSQKNFKPLIFNQHVVNQHQVLFPSNLQML